MATNATNPTRINIGAPIVANAATTTPIAACAAANATAKAPPAPNRATIEPIPVATAPAINKMGPKAAANAINAIIANCIG